MGDLSVELKCAACGAAFRMALGELKGAGPRCPDCDAEVSVTEEQIEAAVVRRMRAERKAMKPKLGGL